MLLAAISSTAVAAPKMVVQPVQLAEESIRYNHGIPTIDQFSTGGSVQVRPAPLDHGSLAFNIAVYNTGTQSINIDVANFTLMAGEVTVTAQTADRLQQKAQSRAAWAQFAVAMAGGLSAVAAASQRDTYRSTFVTPRGTYRSYYSAPSAYGQLQATAAIAGAGLGVAAIQTQLDKTLDELGSQIVQITTVDPGESYAGTIVFEKVKITKLPQQVTMIVDWAGQKYPFTFQLAKPGTPAPAFKPTPIVPADHVPAISSSETVDPTTAALTNAFPPQAIPATQPPTSTPSLGQQAPILAPSGCTTWTVDKCIQPSPGA
jgi:hypothetical protein